MIANKWYATKMNSMEGFIAEMEIIGRRQFPRMQRDHATFLITTLYQAISSLVAGNCNLIDVSIASKLFDEFSKPIVDGAILNGTCFNRKSYDAYLSRRNEAYGESAVLKATELQAEKSLARNWNDELRAAFNHVSQRPIPERKLEALRKAFLDRVEGRNELIEKEYPGQALLKFDELRMTLNALG